MCELHHQLIALRHHLRVVIEEDFLRIDGDDPALFIFERDERLLVAATLVSKSLPCCPARLPRDGTEAKVALTNTMGHSSPQAPLAL